MAAALNVNLSYTITLTPQQFRVVMACLRAGAEDKELKPEWRPEAAAIQDMLFHARNDQVKTQLSAIQRMQGDENEEERQGNSGAKIAPPITIRGDGSASRPTRPVNRDHPSRRDGA